MQAAVAGAVASPAGRRVRPDAVGVAILLVLTAIVAWDRLRGLGALSRTDILTQYLPWYAYLGEHLRAFDIPGWNPHVFSGAPFAGDPQSGWGYVPAMLFFTVLPPVAAFATFVVFHLVLGGVGMFVLARVLGLAVPASVLAGATFEFGTLLESTRCCTFKVQLVAWLPLALLGVELATSSRAPLRRLGWWIVTGFAISQMLVGWTGQGAYNGLLLVGGYVVYRTMISPPTGRPPFRDRAVDLLRHGAAVFAIGLGLGAAGLLPRLAVVGRSNLEGGDYQDLDASSGGWSPIHLLYRTLNDEATSLRWYVGGATVVLALLAPVVAGRRHAVPFFAVTSAVVLTLALDDTVVHDAFYLLPGFEQFHEHVPNRVLAILPVGLAMLAGATVEAVRRPRLPWWAGAAALASLGALAWVQAELRQRDWELTARTFGAAAVAAGLVVIAAGLGPGAHRRRPGAVDLTRALIPVVLIAVVVWDLSGTWHDRAARDDGRDPRAASTVRTLASPERSGAAEFIAAESAEDPGRYFGYDARPLDVDDRRETYHARYDEPEVAALLVSNRAIRLDLFDAQGYNPIQVERYVELFEALNRGPQNYHASNVRPAGLDSPLLDLLNVRFVVVPDEVPPGRDDLALLAERHRTVFVGEGVRVLDRTTALPRAWLVHEAEEVDPETSLEQLSSGAVDPRQVALLETEPPPLAQPGDGVSEDVQVTDYQADSIDVRVEAEADGLLMLSEVYDPGWEAFVDGEEVDVHRADHTFRAVPVPAGDHVVELRYRPPWLRFGLALTLVTMVVVAAAAAWLWRRQRSGQVPRGAC